jgi:hypothetical protein
VTSGELEGSTFVEWTGNFSSDADAGMSHACNCNGWLSLPVYGQPLADECAGTGVIQDAKFKRREALADLAKAAMKK